MGLTPLAAARRSPVMDRLGVALRQEEEADRDWLAALFASTRDDVAHAPWPDTVRALFLAEQFRLQRAHHDAHHPRADRLIMLVGGERAGRLLVDRDKGPWRLVDLAIDPLHRGRGIGAALVRWLQREGRRAGIDLHVAQDNRRAAALYARLGFVPVESGSATHARMAWTGR